MINNFSNIESYLIMVVIQIPDVSPGKIGGTVHFSVRFSVH